MPLPKPNTDEEQGDFLSRCMGNETMKGDFPDNEQRLAVCFSQWKGKETKEATMSNKLSDKNKKNLLQTALISEYGLGAKSPIPKNITVEEVFDDQVIYEVDGQFYQAGYEVGENGEPIFTDPKKVLATRIFKVQEALSMENKREILQTALTAQLNLSKDEHIWVEDMTDAEVFYGRDGKTFKVNFTIAEDGTVTLGNPEEVIRQVVYKSLESLQTAYSDIIQEAGRRNASLDSGRIKKIYELCKELLSSEVEPDEKIVKEAVKEANKTLKWLREQAVVKTEDGVQFPVIAYAYVPNIEESSTWKLRLWEDLEKKVTRAQLGRSAAALSPGGFRGQRVQILAADLPAVKRKVRTEYRNLGTEDADIPKWVKDSETREIVTNFTPLTEATFDKGRASVIVIKAGFNATEDRYYPADVLKRDFGIFEGQKMYADHPTEEEDKARPERSIKDWVATLTEVKCDDNGVVTGIAEIVEPWLMQKLAALRDKKMLSEMGISINAVGTASKSTIDGKETLVIEKLEAARSVDFVTEPGAGGVVTLYESDRTRDVDLIELSTLREKRPDLVKSIEASVRKEIQQEVRKTMEDKERITELESANETLTTENKGLKTKITEGEKAQAKAEAQAAIKEAVDQAELPEASKERLIERFKEAESADGIEEAIQSERDYIAKLSEAGKVTNMGKTQSDPDKDKEALRESVKKANPDYTDEEVEAFIEGK